MIFNVSILKFHYSVVQLSDQCLTKNDTLPQKYRGRNEKYHHVALLLKILENFYKSSDYSTTFTASRVNLVAKEQDNTVEELAFGEFLR